MHKVESLVRIVAFVTLIMTVMLHRNSMASVDTAWTIYSDGPGSGGDAMSDIEVDEAGFVYVAGASDVDSGASSNDFDIQIKKYSTDGALVWSWQSNDSASTSETLHDIVVTSSGEVFATGGRGASGSPGEFVTLRLSEHGTLLWIHEYVGPLGGNNVGTSVIPDGSGGAYACGMSRSHPNFLFDIVVLHLRFDGSSDWAFRFPDAPLGYYWPSNIYTTSDGDVVVGGQFAGGSPSIGDFGLIKLSPDGDTIWTRVFDGVSHLRDEPAAMHMDTLDNIYIGGYSDTGEFFGQRNYDYLVAKYSQAGELLWSSTAEVIDDGDDLARDLAVSPDGMTAVVGRTNEDMTLAVWDPDGNYLWSKQIDGGLNQYDEGVSVCFDSTNAVYATGAIISPDGKTSVISVKYDASGVNRWTRTFGLALQAYGAPVKIVATDAGPTFVGAPVVREAGNPETMLIKYDLCNCPCHADPACDGTLSDVKDVVYVIGYVFGSAPESLVQCNHYASDVDCNGSRDIVDIVKVINVAFRGEPSVAQYCQYSCPP